MTDNKTSEIQFGERIGTGGSDAILASYFRDILKHLAINSGRFQFLLDKYIISQGMASNAVDSPLSRSALYRELMSSTMTWKVFIKGLLFLRVKSVVITIILYRDDCSTTAHDLELSLVGESHIGDDEPNTLAKFFDSILKNLGVIDGEDNKLFHEYLDQYIKVAKPGASVTEQYTAKCQIHREILKKNISWKVFVKGLLFLKTSRIVIESQLTFQTGLVATVSKKLEFR